MATDETVVLVGAGLTTAHAVASLRDSGFDGSVVVYGDEPHRPYERPPLSKGYLLGRDERSSVFAHDDDWYGEHDVELRLGTTVTGIDLDRQEVHAGDDRQRFDRLLIATGAAPRRLRLADESGAPVAYLRTLEDSERLKSTFETGVNVLVVGGGWIGLEVAAAAREAGATVTLVESLELPLLRVLGREVAATFADLHRDHGVDLRLGTSVESMTLDRDRAVVLLDDGTSLDVDLVVVGIGVEPRTSLAESAGLEVDDGIVVDATLRTSHPAVFAAGDVARAMHPKLGTSLRVEHWDNAIEQGKVVGQNLAGKQVGYDRLPYFFTDQYDLGMEYVGHVGGDGYDEVVLRGDVQGLNYTALWLGGGRVLAGMHVNDWDAIEPLRGLVGRNDIDQERLKDTSLSLTDLVG